MAQGHELHDHVKKVIERMAEAENRCWLVAINDGKRWRGMLRGRCLKVTPDTGVISSR